MTQGLIRIRGARQHNLHDLDLDIRTGELTVLTGPSGSGKSSLVFDTLYAEGQRRYVETFSPWARQFLERMDHPAVDAIEGVPPAIAIDQVNPVRNSRSTVGTMTGINDHIKLLFAHAAQLFDRHMASLVQQDTAHSICRAIQEDLGQRPDAAATRIAITFAVRVAAGSTVEELRRWLAAGGFVHILAERMEAGAPALDVVADRFRWSTEPDGARLHQAVEAALQHGDGQMALHVLPAPGSTQEPEKKTFSRNLHCPASGISYQAPVAARFSFNSPLGACTHCRGFGRVIGIDWALVVPDARLTLREGAIKPVQTPAWQDIQRDLLRHAEREGIPRDTPWQHMDAAQRAWVLDGSPRWNGKWSQTWYGLKRFFEYLEGKSYKTHIRVLLSRYRSHTLCPVCHGARLQEESLCWRLGSKAAADAALPPAKRFMPPGVRWTRAQLEALPGLCLHDLMCLPLNRLRDFLLRCAPDAEEAGASAQARRVLHAAIGARLQYLCDVGLGYLTLERQSRSLSGGEVQRINLTTALGTALTGTLFVLDEPSIGLHPRDMQRIIAAMRRLLDAGNTLVAVEHDPALMRAAGRIIDMGPGPGAAGGRVVFDGPPAALAQADTLTGAYLGGRKRVGFGPKRAVTDATPRLVLRGARQHNLRAVDVAFPLQRLVVVSGVSGSGKSTLIHAVLAPALLRHFGRASVQAGGTFESLHGAGQISDVVVVDQLGMGKTARSTPASYVGAWDGVRKLLAATPLAQARAYTAATFSFNSGDGRCPACGGAGFEHVEMQFLSDVYLRCTECGGKRWKRAVLEVMLDFTRADGSPAQAHAADLLEWTVLEAVERFGRMEQAPAREIVRALQPLLDVGLHYLRLGQSVPTLSGGEAQRLKLAGFLAEAAKRRHGAPEARTLFLLDEPTTGLHFDDIACLLRALRKLLHAGHSIIVIEHNLDIIRASDWLIDMGPEAGEDGGRIVAEGPPERLRQHPTSHTARALREYDLDAAHIPAVQERAARPPPPQAIAIHGAREHNLREVSLRIPHNRFTVVTGVSGSGKSTLAFDILFHEGQRRYLESINAWARSIVQGGSHQADVDAIDAIPPTVAVAQRSARAGHQSTVGTSTEIWHFLRLLFVKLGVRADGKTASACAMEARHFSWSSPLGWCPHCRGSGLQPSAAPAKKRPSRQRSGREQSFAELEQEDAPGPDAHPCPACHGTRLAPSTLAVYLEGKNIAELAAMPIDALHAWMQQMPGALDARAARIARDPLAEILRRLQFLQSVGLGYLTLARAAPTLSGGEAQRMRLAAQLGSQLQGVCYVLDEPTIGLHPRDRHLLLAALEQLARRGNTLVVVEHDEETMRRAGHIIDMGPGAGLHGGRVVAQGSLEDILGQPESITGQCLRAPVALPAQPKRKIHIADSTIKEKIIKNKKIKNVDSNTEKDTENIKWLHILGAHRHNLRDVDQDLPLHRLVAITGVSGSGKSTLAREVLLPSLLEGRALGCRKLHGQGDIDRVLEVDQSPIGKTPRSCPATYIGFWDAIRQLFAQSLYAREQGWTAGRFSFNTAAGRCPVCAGQGVRTVEMRFLPDIQLPCEACHGARFNPQTLQALWRGQNIAQVLAMRVEQAADFFASMPAVARALQLLCDLGLGYLSLGQPSPTLSGGEAQRVKLVAELAKAQGSRQHTLYVLDEPTVGLHMHDVQRLARVLHRLVDAGHSVLVIEHDLDIIAQADWVIDMGPQGGDGGGRVVFAGTPQQLAQADTYTGQALAQRIRQQRMQQAGP